MYNKHILSYKQAGQTGGQTRLKYDEFNNLNQFFR
jgi:hypothetical protein